MAKSLTFVFVCALCIGQLSCDELSSAFKDSKYSNIRFDQGKIIDVAVIMKIPNKKEPWRISLDAEMSVWKGPAPTSVEIVLENSNGENEVFSVSKKMAQDSQLVRFLHSYKFDPDATKETEVLEYKPFEQTALSYAVGRTAKVALSDSKAEVVGVTFLDKESDHVFEFCGRTRHAREERLDCQASRLTDLSALERMTNLRSLELTNLPDVDLSPLKNLKKLLHLDLRDSKVKKLDAIGELTALKRLWLAGGSIDDITPLSRLKNIEDIELSRNPVKTVAPLANLHKLESLSIDGTGVVDLTPIRKLTNLKSLNFGNTMITDLSSISDLVNLERLRANDLVLDDLTPLHNLKKLKHLRLWSATVKKEDLEALQKTIPGLEIDHH